MERVVHIIDDDALWRTVLVGMLAPHPDVRTVEWETGDAFRDAVEKAPGLALIDVKMPGLSGTELLGIIDQERFVPIMMSGNADVALAVDAVKQGAHDVLEKPCTPDKLAETISGGFSIFEERHRALLAREATLGKFEALSDREREVVREIAADHSNRAVGEKFGISIRTVEAHRARIMLKLGASSFAEVVSLAHACGFASESRKSRELAGGQS
tara:strand:+ start:3007 stop:3648 length:642 start_codon:yes stop_codon:yes gene_type:complete